MLIHFELIMVVAGLPPDNPIPNLSKEKIIEWVEIDEDVHIEEILIDKVIIQSI